MQEAHLLLQKHGQTLCKRENPLCGECPLRTGCAFARATCSSLEKSPLPIGVGVRNRETEKRMGEKAGG